MTELQYPVPPLNDWQRQKVREFYELHPDGGYKNALAHAGIHASKAVAKQTILSDDDLADVPMLALKVDEGSALKAIGEILANTDHKDRLRAATFALAALHGVSEKQALELSGPDGGPVKVEDRSASLVELAAVLKQSGALDGS